MNDNLDQKLEALFAAARADAQDTSRLEYGFETRLNARLRGERSASIFAWAWRLCPIFAALALAVAWWNHSSLRTETEIVVEAAQGSDEQMLVAYLTGQHP